MTQERMSYSDALQLRSRYLAGEAIATDVLEQSIIAIRNCSPTHPGVALTRSVLPELLMMALARAPMEREEFYSMAREAYAAAGRKPPMQQIAYLKLHGFIRDEIVLAERGRQRLNLSPTERRCACGVKDRDG